VLLSQRLIHDELYTSLHIERYEVEVRDTIWYGITAQLPMKSTNVDYLDDRHCENEPGFKLGYFSR
jgi:DNA-directed RNA polymerase beta subunit